MTAKPDGFGCGTKRPAKLRANTSTALARSSSSCRFLDRTAGWLDGTLYGSPCQHSGCTTSNHATTSYRLFDIRHGAERFFEQREQHSATGQRLAEAMRRRRP